MQSRYDARSSEREAAQAHRRDPCKLRPGVNVVFDHDLQPERGMMKQSDQKEDHQGDGERRPHPGDERGVVAAGMRDVVFL